MSVCVCVCVNVDKCVCVRVCAGESSPVFNYLGMGAVQVVSVNSSKTNQIFQ